MQINHYSVLTGSSPVNPSLLEVIYLWCYVYLIFDI